MDRSIATAARTALAAACVPLVLAGYGGGCTKKGSEAGRSHVEKPRKAPPTRDDGSAEDGGEHKSTSPATSWRDAPRTHLVLVLHEPKAERAGYADVPVTADGAALGPTYAAPAIPHPHRDGAYVAVAAHNRGTVWATARTEGDAFVVDRRGLEDDAVISVSLGEDPPAAMHVIGDIVYAGVGTRVMTVDFGSGRPHTETLRERPQTRFKAYDLFTRSGDWLVAVDDEVIPMYADGFRIDATGHAFHREDWSLPDVINGHYEHAALHRTGPADGSLYLVSSFGTLDGSGHILARVPIRDGKLATTEHTLDNGGSGEVAVLIEEIPRDEGPPRVSAGTELTPWTAMALWTGGDAPALLVAAGARGLLRLPTELGPDTKATMVDLGGPCHDVLVDDERIWTLVGGDDRQLVELQAKGDTFEPKHRLALPEAYSRIVR